MAVTHRQGLMVGARSFPGNPYDGHTLAAQLEQTTTLLQDIGVNVSGLPIIPSRGRRILPTHQRQGANDGSGSSTGQGHCRQPKGYLGWFRALDRVSRQPQRQPPMLALGLVWLDITN
jgi:hypothetical protein